MICLKAHWANAPIPCPFKSRVEARYVSELLDQADGDVRLLQDLFNEARKQPNSSFQKMDAIARANATAGFLPSESSRAAFVVEFLNLGKS